MDATDWSHSSEGRSLQNWLNYQCQLERQGQLSSFRKKKLDKIGFEWNVQKEPKPASPKVVRPSLREWDKMFEELLAFQVSHRRLPEKGDKKHAELFRWVEQQRSDPSSRTDSHRAKWLDESGFWDPKASKKRYEKRWKVRFCQLFKYKDRYGTTRVSQSNGGESLFFWTYDQRKAKRDGRLLPHREQKLDSIDFDWSIQEKLKYTGGNLTVGLKLRKVRSWPSPLASRELPRLLTSFHSIFLATGGSPVSSCQWTTLTTKCVTRTATKRTSTRRNYDACSSPTSPF